MVAAQSECVLISLRSILSLTGSALSDSRDIDELRQNLSQLSQEYDRLKEQWRIVNGLNLKLQSEQRSTARLPLELPEIGRAPQELRRAPSSALTECSSLRSDSNSDGEQYDV